MNNQEPSLRLEFEEIENKLQDPAIFSSKEYPKLAKRRQELSDVIELFNKKNSLEKEKYIHNNKITVKGIHDLCTYMICIS